jgi:hypothetical protein
MAAERPCSSSPSIARLRPGGDHDTAFRADDENIEPLRSLDPPHDAIRPVLAAGRDQTAAYVAAATAVTRAIDAHVHLFDGPLLELPNGKDPSSPRSSCPSAEHGK